MQSEQETQWREKVNPEGHQHEAHAPEQVQHHEPLAVLAVQIDPQLKHAVLRAAYESGVSVDDLVRGVLHRAVNAPEQHLDGFHTLLSNLTGKHQEALSSKIAEGEYAKRFSGDAPESVAVLSR